MFVRKHAQHTDFALEPLKAIRVRIADQFQRNLLLRLFVKREKYFLHPPAPHAMQKAITSGDKEIVGFEHRSSAFFASDWTVLSARNTSARHDS